MCTSLLYTPWVLCIPTTLLTHTLPARNRYNASKRRDRPVLYNRPRRSQFVSQSASPATNQECPSTQSTQSQRFEQNEAPSGNNRRFSDSEQRTREAPTQGGHPHSPYIGSSNGSTGGVSVTADDAVWVRGLEQVNKESQGNSEPRYSQGGNRNSHGHHSKRIRFSGETLAHSILPNMDGHAEIPPSPDDKVMAPVDRELLRQGAPTVSDDILEGNPWKWADCQAHMDILRHLPEEDRHYLYMAKKVFRIPLPSIADKLIALFFRFVYPLYPIVDRQNTVESYEKLQNDQGSSPLLFHAIFFSACQYAPEHLLREAGFSNVAEAKSHFFQRAKLLHAFDCEPNQIHVIQSLMLLSSWWMDYAEEKETRYWLSSAVHLALTMGMHRTVSESVEMSQAHTILWRRIFWLLLVNPPCTTSYIIEILKRRLMLKGSRSQCCSRSWPAISTPSEEL